MPRMQTEEIVEQVTSRAPAKEGIFMLLGGADTGKTTIAKALANKWASSKTVALIDADIGQSHIGPPTTVGWILLTEPGTDVDNVAPTGISFVGHISPVGYLLQFITAVLCAIRHASGKTNLLIIDTPGLVRGPAAKALWWAMQNILQPQMLIALHRGDELNEVLKGLKFLDTKLCLFGCPPSVRSRTSNYRRNYRQARFKIYFRDSRTYNLDLKKLSIQSIRGHNPCQMLNRLVALRNAEGVDEAIGVVRQWQSEKGLATILAPQLDIDKIRCLVIGGHTLNINLAADTKVVT